MSRKKTLSERNHHSVGTGIQQALAYAETLDVPFVCGSNGNGFLEHDLLAPFRAFHYNHPDQAGSASMKAVLPALIGKSCGEMPIADGGTASKEFLRVTFGQATTVEREKVRAQLEEYCGLDTSGMSDIVKKLQEMVFTS